MKREIKLAGIAALVLGTTGVANASSLFETQDLGTGFQVRSTLLNDFNPFMSSSKELKCGEATCGEAKKAEAKKAEAKCGEAKKAEAKCGEGKKAEAKCGEAKKAEAKCGEGKCGEGKCGEGKKPATKK